MWKEDRRELQLLEGSFGIGILSALGFAKKGGALRDFFPSLIDQTSA